MGDIIDAYVPTASPSDTCEPHEDTFSHDLYNGAQISVGLSVILIMSFVINHGLTDAALRDLLQIISLHCPSPNLCITSLYIFKKFFAATKFNFKRHYYCPSCKTSIDDLRLECPNVACGERLSNPDQSYFIELSIFEQLQNLLRQPGFYNQLQHRFLRTKRHQSDIEDVYDGQLYTALMKPGQFLANPHNISFQLNTDGVQLFYSSKYGMWPIYLKINELPAKIRCFMKNKIIAAIWLGEMHPAINTFLKPLRDAMVKLFKDGITVESPDVSGSFKCRAILLSSTCDLPAKALLLNTIGHNGFYGCPRCTQPGKTTNTVRGHVHTFPYISTDPTGPLRTVQTMEESAKQALQEHTTVNGIRGPGSCLMTFPHHNICRGTAIDYMHCVLLNVVRQLIRLWFDPAFSSEIWSCSRSVSLVDSRLESIQPPSLITRVTRAVSNRKFWKASEYRAWLFFYSLPVMYMVLPDVYYQHYVLLCEAIYILNSKSVEARALKKSRKLLQHFYFMFPTLYSERYLGCNIHQLLHLPDTVKDLGPLFTTSCFDHEDTNGKLARMVHSHACVGSQITVVI